jgi:hypothetical protein
MPEPKNFIVGRTREVEQFSKLVKGGTRHWVLNIYGPGGIGKTIVGHKMQEYAQSASVPIAFVDGIQPDLTPDRILFSIKEGLAKTESLADNFQDFDRQFEEHLIIQEVLQRGGGMQSMFDAVGNIKDPTGFAQIVTGLGKTITEEVKRIISNRFALERYLRGTEKVLTNSLSTSLSVAVEKSKQSLAVIVDTYEEMEGLDDWFCRTLTPSIPDGVKLIVLGRNSLAKINFDWAEHGQALFQMELPELEEGDAKAYLVHRGLRDAVALEKFYRFTGGYPLLLVLVWHLSREVGGWDKIGELVADADRDRISTKLLERILREERVKEVQAFLEKGVVARWFTPEVISVILEIGAEEGRKIYDQLARHSFVERHPYGLKFHDKIRELLLVRLKFNRSEYDQIVKRLSNYYAEKAGIASK